MQTRFARLTASLAIAFLGAVPFSMASGMMQTGRSDIESNLVLIIASGIILFFLSVTLFGLAIQLVRTTIGYLGRVEERPSQAMALGMLGTGAFCAVAAVFVQYKALEGNPGIAMNLDNSVGMARIAMRSSGSFALGFLTFLTFTLGAALIGLGIWAGLKPATRAPSTPIKNSVSHLDEARL